jgi:DNA-binding transcriptional LysR family regulator
MELRQLRYFVTLAAELHFGRAAEREHIVQSALSQQLQRLERELGVRLLDRSTHHVSLTAAGAMFLAEAQQILAHADRAAGAARNAAGAVAALRAGIIDSGYDSMPLILREVQARFPGLVIHQVEASVPGSTSSLATGAWTPASAGPRSPRRASPRCCSAATPSEPWSPPVTGSPDSTRYLSPSRPPKA